MICIDIKTWIHFSENNSQQSGMKRKMDDQNLQKIFPIYLTVEFLKKTAVRRFYLTFNDGNPSKQNNKKNAQEYKKRLIFHKKKM